ncbi:MAG: hypothetical protein M1835_002180 [Candelina submexicana]|nr:MAG: hypothetical protein M1835_002180 [Candelina submexicana]
MNQPRTPKKAPDGLNEFIQALSETWALQLPLRQDTLSPSSRARLEKNTNAEASRCVAGIKYLYYKDKDALRKIEEDLGEYARSMVVDWKYKPQQEPGTLPQLPIPAVRNYYLAKLEKSSQAPNDLRERLLKLLEDARYLVVERSKPAGQGLLFPEVASRPRPSIYTTALATDSTDSYAPGVPILEEMAPKKNKPERTDPRAGRISLQSSIKDFYKSTSKPSSTTAKRTLPNEPTIDSSRAADLAGDPASLSTREQPIIPAYPPLESSVGYMDDDYDEDFRSFRTQKSEPDTSTSGKSTSRAIDSTFPKQEVDQDTEVFFTPPSSPPPFIEATLSRQLARLNTENLAGDLSTDISFTKMADLVPIPSPKPVRKRKIDEEIECTRKRGLPDIDIAAMTSPEANPSFKVSTYTPTRPSKAYHKTSEPEKPSLPSNKIFSTIPSVNTSFDSNDSAETSFSSVFSESISRSNITSAATSFISACSEVPKTSYKRRSTGISTSNTSANLNSVPTMVKPNALTSSTTSSRLSVQSYLEKYLFSNGPLSHHIPVSLEANEIRVRYELTRVALDCKIPLADFSNLDTEDFSEYSTFWSSIFEQQLRQSKTAVRQSSAQAWENSSDKAGRRFKDVSMTGDLAFNDCRSGPLVRLTLNPLKIEPSFRYARRFGNDRFLVLSLPELSATQMPKHVSQEEVLVRETIIRWLCSTEHTLFGRTWKAFSCKPVKGTKSGKKESKSDVLSRSAMKINEPSYHIFFFAVSGCDMLPNPNKVSSKGEGLRQHTEMSVHALLDWGFPWARNPNMAYPKAFQRYHLLLSKTQATVVFRPSEVIRCDDTTTHTSLPRRLDPRRSALIKKNGRGKSPKNVPTPAGVVMNDGCSRMSYAAACDIAETLHLDYKPCAYQGRIAGGKGVWVVDYTDEKLTTSERNRWIEITDSQWKYEGHPMDDALYPDEDRLTFEVCNWSRPLSSATLNEQLIPILVDRQRPKSSIENALKDLLEEDLSLRVSRLRAAMEDPLALRKWNQENNSVSDERAKLEDVRSLGALPAELGEQINWFLESGFTPRNCSFFLDRMKKAITVYRERLVNRMHMGVAKSTTCLMIADPTGQLEEGEVQLCFSRPFTVPDASFQDDILCDLDCLVSRNPAHCPWDIQKVRAVYKPGLRKYKDVIVFSCKGKRPLAEALSGGDYDGDTAWVCWEPRLVDNFINQEPPEPTNASSMDALNTFGIIQEKETITDMTSCADFLLRGFTFNLQPNILGMCTSFRERLCYKENSISSNGAMLLATLLGLLVDAPKQGYTFTENMWQTFLSECPDLTSTWAPIPAYKLKDAVATEHIIDQLLLVKAKNVINSCMKRFYSDFTDIQSSDNDLTDLWNGEYDGSSIDARVKEVLNQLIIDVRKVNDYWRDHVSRDEEASHREKKFATVVEDAYAQFSGIMPRRSDHPLILWWAKEAKRSGDASFWSRLKASEAFCKFANSSFPWYMAGKQLGEMKARTRGNYRTIIPSIYVGLKLDPGHVKRIESKRPVLDKADEPEEDDGVWE